LLDVALGVAPGLATATLAEIRIGLRPFSPDGLPVLGRAPGVANVFPCTGNGPSGLQQGPVCGAFVANLINDETPALDLTPFRPERYLSTQGEQPSDVTESLDTMI
jgi:D-amino-acid dehydrogenase